MLEPTPYFYEFLNYYDKAEKLQNEGNLGGKPYLEIEGVDDSLMQNVTIYDTVERKHAGFSNILQDLWHGSKAPKYYKWGLEHQERNKIYDNNHYKWGLEEWAYLFLVHRLTGSGASFEEDHGYRNTPIISMALYDNIDTMKYALTHKFEEKEPIFTSIGNQIPAFPKCKSIYSQGVHYLYYDCVELTKDLCEWLSKGNRKTLRQVADFLGNWNKERGYRNFKFCFSAVAADFADYFPEYVDPASEFYHGKNAVEALSYMFIPRKKMKKDTFLDYALEACSEAVDGYQYDVEDVCCDSIRWIENYIPLGRERTYEHLCLDSIWNNSKIKSHPKGRQKAKLDLGIINTFNDIKSFGDFTVLETLGLTPEDYRAKLIEGGIQCPLLNL
jgi:hypothetical protein